MHLCIKCNIMQEEKKASERKVASLLREIEDLKEKHSAHAAVLEVAVTMRLFT